MKKKIFILIIILVVSLIFLVVPSVYILSYSGFRGESILALALTLENIFAMVPFLTIGAVGLKYSVKKLLELL